MVKVRRVLVIQENNFGIGLLLGLANFASSKYSNFVNDQKSQCGQKIWFF